MQSGIDCIAPCGMSRQDCCGESAIVALLAEVASGCRRIVELRDAQGCARGVRCTTGTTKFNQQRDARPSWPR